MVVERIHDMYMHTKNNNHNLFFKITYLIIKLDLCELNSNYSF